MHEVKEVGQTVILGVLLKKRMAVANETELNRMAMAMLIDLMHRKMTGLVFAFGLSKLLCKAMFFGASCVKLRPIIAWC